MRHHDLIVIGSGSGNSFLDARFEHLDVSLVEHGTFGGTCLNVPFSRIATFRSANASSTMELPEPLPMIARS